MKRRPSTDVARGRSPARGRAGACGTRRARRQLTPPRGTRRRHVEARRALLELDGAGVVEDLVAGDDALAVRRRDAPPDARRPVAEALVERMLEREAAAEPPAEAGDPPGAHGQVLILGHAQRDRLLVRRVAARALAAAAEPVVAAEARALARADRAQLHAPVAAGRAAQTAASPRRPPLGLVGEDEARAVEDELGRDGLQLDALLLDDVPEDPHGPPGLFAVGLAVSWSTSVARRRTLLSGNSGSPSRSWFALTTRPSSWPREVWQITFSFQARSSPPGSKE